MQDGRAERDVRAQRRIRRAWARGVMDGILGQLGPGDLCLDCGANVGEVSGPIAETGAAVYAFEPDPVAFAALSVRLSGHPAARAVNAAVGVEAGTATLHRAARFDDDPLAATVSSTLMAGKRDSDAGGANDLAVEVLSLPDLLDDLLSGRAPAGLPALPSPAPRRVALLKLDIEGGELELLPALHARDLLSRIGCTLVETHQRKFPAMRRDFLAMRRDIAQHYPPRKVNLDWI